MRFDMTEHKREKLTAQIKAYLQAGIVGVTNLRRYRRVPVPAEGTFMRANGDEIVCSIRDFSLQGAFLETQPAARRWVKMITALGHHRGRVVRHEDTGIAIQFDSRARRAKKTRSRQ